MSSLDNVQPSIEEIWPQKQAAVLEEFDDTEDNIWDQRNVFLFMMLCKCPSNGLVIFRVTFDFSGLVFVSVFVFVKEKSWALGWNFSGVWICEIQFYIQTDAFCTVANKILSQDNLLNPPWRWENLNAARAVGDHPALHRSSLTVLGRQDHHQGSSDSPQAEQLLASWTSRRQNGLFPSSTLKEQQYPHAWSRLIFRSFPVNEDRMVYPRWTMSTTIPTHVCHPCFLI